MERDLRPAITSASDYARHLRTGSTPVNPAAQPALGPGFPDLPEFDDSPRADHRHPSIARAGLGEARFMDGCYLARFRPATPTETDPIRWPAATGTLRVEVLPNSRLIASGDLYRDDAFTRNSAAPPRQLLVPDQPGAPAPRSIPSFPRSSYHAYLRFDDRAGATLPDGSNPDSRAQGAAYLCQCHRIQSIECNAWQPPESVVLTPAAPIHGIAAHPPPATGPFLQVEDAMGRFLGTLELDWISPFFREGIIEIDTEDELAPPLGNDSGDTWEQALARAGWGVRVETGRIEHATPPSGGWTYSELHDALIRSRDQADLDAQWRYHVSVVRRFDVPDAPLGIAFDHEAMDRNDVPREGVAVQADARLPRESAYGPYAGARIRDFPELIFHIGVHELGHAMGLYHNHAGIGVLRQLSNIAQNKDATPLSAEDLAADFAPEDILRLRHLPDIYVRPGGTPWETLGLVEDRDDARQRVAGLHPPIRRPEPEGPCSIEVVTVSNEVPFGAPVRVNFELRNRGRRALVAPAWLGLATPFVRGWVVSPDGEEHEFRSLFKTVSADVLVTLPPDGKLAGSMTLLRGNRGALFRRPGRHSLWVEIEWRHAGRILRARQRTRVHIAPAASAAHDRVARELIRTPETLGYLVLGRAECFRPGERAVDLALDTAELGRHFAYIKARASARRHFDEAENWSEVRRHLSDSPSLAVLNRQEHDSARQLRQRADQHLAAA